MKIRSVLITGASSGIGKALALQFARSGISLHLGGRCQERLMQVATECIALGASVQIAIIDVCDQEKMKAWIYSVGQLDLVLACAGVSASTLDNNKIHHLCETARQVQGIMQINLQGVLNTVLPALEVMQKQPRNEEGIRGRIAAMASIAAFINSAWTPTYCASKAAVDRFMVSSAAGWQLSGIYLSSICCGFVTTPMTDKNSFFMPEKMSAEKAARLIIRGIERKKRRIIFPLWLAWLTRILDFFPTEILEKIYLKRLIRNRSGK